MLDKIVERAKKENKKVYIFAHQCPDGDALGSSLALEEYLRNLGIDATYVLTSPTSDYKKMLGRVPVLSTFDALELGKTIENEIAIILDTSTVPYAQNKLFKYAKKENTYVFDHHQKADANKARDNLTIEDELELPEDNVIRDVNATSTCEILLGQMDKDKVSVSIGEKIFLGLMTDNGNLQHAKKSTLENLETLLSLGLSYENALSKICDKRDLLPDYALSKVILEKIEHFQVRGNDCMIMSIDNELSNDLQLNYRVEKPNKQVYRLAPSKHKPFICTITELEEGKYTCEFKSKDFYGDWNVASIAKDYGGGGHRNASGVTLDGKKLGIASLEEAKEFVKDEALIRFGNKEEATLAMQRHLSKYGDKLDSNWANEELDPVNFEFSEEDSKLKALLDETSYFRKNVDTQMLSRAISLIEEGAHFSTLMAHNVELNEILLRSELISRIPKRCLLDEKASFVIKLSKDDAKVLEEKYGVTDDDILSKVKMFATCSIKTASIEVNGRRTTIDDSGNIVVDDVDLEK